MINNVLKDYDQVREEEVEICEANENPFQSLSQTYMHNTHRTLVPIGANFQVMLPPVLTPDLYRVKSAEMMKTLQIIKINDPEEGEHFYSQHFLKVDLIFGPGRTYEDINHLHNAFKRMNSQLTFDQYIEKNAKHWEAYFKNKDRVMGPKAPAKKKKKKGTIPI